MTNGVVQDCPPAAVSACCAASDTPATTLPRVPPVAATTAGVWASPELVAAVAPPLAWRVPAVVPTGSRVTDEHALASSRTQHNSAARVRRARPLNEEPVRSPPPPADPGCSGSARV